MRTTLTDLAQELIQQICDKVAYQYNSTPEEIKSQLKSLRSVCRQLRYPPEVHLFREVTLNARRKRALSFLTEFDAYINERQPVFKYCRVLRIRFNLGEDVAAAKRIKLPGMSDKFIVPIISSFKHIRSVEWHVEAGDPCPLLVEAINLLPEFKTLILHFNSVPFHDLRFETITQLAKLSMSNIKDERHAREVLAQAAQALESNGSLTHIAVAVDIPHNESIRFPFPLFPKPTEEVPFPNTLQYLRLRGCGFKFKGRPQLGALTHLEIEHTMFPTNANIWSLLGDVKLKSIVVDSMPPPLINYLQSYSGLEKLLILPTANREAWMVQTPVLCEPEIFYKKILPLHKDSIKSLSLNKLSPTDWFPRNPFTESLLQCRGLTTLAIDVPIGEAGTVTKLGVMMNTLLEFPKLDSVGIFWTKDYPFIGDHTLYVWGIERNISEFPLPPRDDVFKITTAANFFEPQLYDGKYRWKSGPIRPVSGIAIGLGWAL